MQFSSYLNQLQASGQYWFTSLEALSTLKISKNALSSALKRMKKQGRIVSLAKQFYLVIPPEHYKLGCLPAEEFIPHLMKFWNLNYYACLLTAAEYYGAAHQRPQRYQVMISRYKPNLQRGKISVQFIQKKECASTPVRTLNTPRSIIRVSSPEATVIDLVRYPMHSGGLNNITTILIELAEAINTDKLFETAMNIADTASLQKCGYLFEHINEKKLAHTIHKVLKQRTTQFIPLSSKHPVKHAIKNSNWKLFVNFKVEVDL